MKVWDTRNHRTWGNNIMPFDWDRRRIVGWTQPHPTIGDELLLEMHSGRIRKVEIVTVEPTGDSGDMWFATVKDIGYV